MDTQTILNKLIDAKQDHANERGNLVQHSHAGALSERTRYMFDFKFCTSAQGWEQWDTDQDAWYFGIWVSRANRQIVTYAEGDMTLVTCPDDGRFAAEIASMEAFYGTPGPAFVVLDLESRTRTEIFGSRLSAEDLEAG